MNEKLSLMGEKIYIREWNIQDAKMLSSLGKNESGENAKIENAEVRIIDWSMKFIQTKLGTLPIFDLSHQLLGIISIQPRIQKNKAVFQLKIIPEQDLAIDHIQEAKILMKNYAKDTLGITELVD